MMMVRARTATARCAADLWRFGGRRLEVTIQEREKGEDGVCCVCLYGGSGRMICREEGDDGE